MTMKTVTRFTTFGVIGVDVMLSSRIAPAMSRPNVTNQLVEPKMGQFEVVTRESFGRTCSNIVTHAETLL